MIRKIVIAIIVAIGLVLSGQAASARPAGITAKKSATKKGTPKVSLRGSKAVARKQNSEADKENLTRVEDMQQLQRFVKAGILVPLKNNLVIRIDPRLDEQYRYCRPWTLQFLERMGRAHYLEFKTPIQVNSAVRTLAEQKALRRTNKNAAPISGDTASSHPTGSTVDITKKGLSGPERRWFRDYLRQQKAAGKIAIAEEFRQPVFHVMVFQTNSMKKPAKSSAR